MSPYSRLQERYSNVLATPPVADPSVCATCRRDTNEFTRCYHCNRHRARFASEIADVAVPIAIAIKGDQLAREPSSAGWSSVGTSTRNTNVPARTWRVHSRPFDWEVCVLCRTA